jgi:cation diffusion facilitator CzcD-associated flavoprotein CzcO
LYSISFVPYRFKKKYCPQSELLEYTNYVIDTSGVLANPHIPNIEGAELFRDAKFHTGQWDHNVPYEGKRVGVIGSGCSAAQIVPAIASQVDKLKIFMGKAQWVIRRSDRNYSSVERFITNRNQ